MLSYQQKDPLVVSGMSCKAAASDNLKQFKDQLYNKVDMIAYANDRFKRAPDIPDRSGIIPTVNLFDNGFFNVRTYELPFMDPVNRMLLEVTCEAIMDAGVSLKELQGSETGIYVGNCFSENEKVLYNDSPPKSFPLTGSARGFNAVLLSHFLQTNGPTYVTDAACCASIYAVNHALMDLEAGKCQNALVCGVNLSFTQNVSRQFYMLGVLARDGRSKSFDAAADGYVRSDGIYCVLIQKASKARRIYAQFRHCMVNCDGFKEMGITYPSFETQSALLSDFYSECQVPFDKIGFVEAHATGTRVGDPIELESLGTVFCASRKDPLLIGSIKSNVGHSEGGAGIASLIKCCLILDSGIILPNINYNTPNPASEALVQGKLVVVTEPTRLPEDKPFVALNNYGFGGANGHILLAKHEDKKQLIEDNQPRLMCIAGRSSMAIDAILTDVKSRPYDTDYIALLNAAFQDAFPEQTYRAYAIITRDGIQKAEVSNTFGDILPLKCFFSSFGVSQLINSLAEFSIFEKHLREVTSILKSNNNNNEWVQSDIVKECCNPLKTVLYTVIVQTGIVKILKQLKIDVEEYVGSGIGEISASYADGVITLDQALLVADKLSKLLCEHQTLTPTIIKTELETFCKIIKEPKRWKVDGVINCNLAAYFSTAILKTVIPKFSKQNMLVIGGANSWEVPRVITICDGNGFVEALGKLYLVGSNVFVNEIYPVVWPVHPGTPNISHLIKWKHDKDWSILNFQASPKLEKQVTVGLGNPLWKFVENHVIDGKILFPATGYLYLVWNTLIRLKQLPLCFENIQFMRASIISSNTSQLNFIVQIYRGTGEFQIIESNNMVVRGFVRIMDDFDDEWTPLEPLPSPPVDHLMSTRDVYKEMGLRGYYYQGDFRGMINADVNCTMANLRWTQWISFLDAMLQLVLLEQDTRSLFVPTEISKIIIHIERHLDLVYSHEDIFDCSLPCYHYKEMGTVRCGFIEMRGLKAKSIARRKHPTPVLEVNRFVPYKTELDLVTAARVMAQIALENNYTTKLRAIEVLTNFINNDVEPILPHIQAALNDQPLIQPDCLLVTNKKISFGGIAVEEMIPSGESGVYMAIGSSLLNQPKILKTLLSILKPDGFIISREKIDTHIQVNEFVVLCEYTTSNEKLLMMTVKRPIVRGSPINIAAKDFSWMHAIKAAQQNKETLLIYSENEANNGLMGLTNCLKREAGEEKLSSVLIDDVSAPSFDPSNSFYKDHLDKNLSVNVYQNGTWGSYRHLKLTEKKIKTTHCFVYPSVRGDLSSLTWVQGPLSVPDAYDLEIPDYTTIEIYECSLNFRDIMMASGKINMDVFCKDRRKMDGGMGVDFAGKTKDGKRVMGNTVMGSMATAIKERNSFLLEIPDDWTMTDAATIPCVAVTCIVGLIERAQLREGESILIHSATGAVGQTALNIAEYFKCKIFVTVGTETKRNYIREKYPFIPEDHIGNSHDTSFAEMVLRNTNGEGVDIILNSLADEKLQASVACLSFRGRFIEIGKFDLSKNTALNVDLTRKGAEYYGVMLDDLAWNPNEMLPIVLDKTREGIRKGYIKPLPRKCFKYDELEAAFRYMTTGKHMGKVILKIREEENRPDEIVPPRPHTCMANYRLQCSPKGTYIVVGGLGGFGVELVDWLALRGAINIILVTTSGLKNGYQKFRMRIWKKYDCRIVVSKHDVTTMEGCEALLRMAQDIGDIRGVFNLAVILKDAVFEKQTEDTFRDSYNPKAQATIYLDQLTRTMAPNLEHFVVFSSVSCGRGNAGQTNYGYSNSVMERVCEQRRRDGLPGKAIQWGVVGDVGIVADLKEQNIDIVIGGTLHQRIGNCLEVLDNLLSADDTIVSSMVVAEKKVNQAENDIIATVANILEIEDIKTVSPHSPLPEVGMDSMNAVEIKQTLERDFDIFLTPQDLRNMTFAKLAELSSLNKQEDTSVEAASLHFQQLMRFMPTEDECTDRIVQMKTLCTNSNNQTSLFLLPGVEGMSTVFDVMAAQLTGNVKCLQFCSDDTKPTLIEMATQKFQILEEEFKSNQTFSIAAHSMGSTVALETLSMLEEIGYVGTLFLLDGAPTFNKVLFNTIMNTSSEDLFQVTLIINILSVIIDLDRIESKRKILMEAKSLEERCQIAISAAPEKLNYSDEFLETSIRSIYKRVRAENDHIFKSRTYKSRIVLCKASSSSVPNFLVDYGLSDIMTNEYEVKTFKGDHISILHNSELIHYVNTNI